MEQQEAAENHSALTPPRGLSQGSAPAEACAAASSGLAAFEEKALFQPQTPTFPAFSI